MKYYINNKNYLIIIYNNYMIKLNNEFIKRNKRKRSFKIYRIIIIFHEIGLKV